MLAVSGAAQEGGLFLVMHEGEKGDAGGIGAEQRQIGRDSRLERGESHGPAQGQLEKEHDQEGFLYR